MAKLVITYEMDEEGRWLVSVPELVGITLIADSLDTGKALMTDYLMGLLMNNPEVDAPPTLVHRVL